MWHSQRLTAPLLLLALCVHTGQAQTTSAATVAAGVVPAGFCFCCCIFICLSIMCRIISSQSQKRMRRTQYPGPRHLLHREHVTTMWGHGGATFQGSAVQDNAQSSTNVELDASEPQQNNNYLQQADGTRHSHSEPLPHTELPPLGFGLVSNSASAVNTESKIEAQNLPNAELVQGDAPPSYDTITQYPSAPPPSNQPLTEATARLSELEDITLRQEREIQELREQLEQRQSISQA